MTIFKDYYTILGVRPVATPAEIKKSYRRLAMKYHPDKNPGDALANAVFQDISEAYKILSNPETRRQYDYKNTGDFNKRAGGNIVTEDSVINEITVLQKTVAAANDFQINEDALFFRITQILSPFKVQLLQLLPTDKKRRLTGDLLLCCSPLTYNHNVKVSAELLKIAADDENTQNTIQEFLQKSLRASRWARYKVLLAIAIAILSCLAMFLLR